MVLSAAGKNVGASLHALEDGFPTILLDCFVVMPNHVHGVIMLGAKPHGDGQQGAMNRAATGESGSARLIEP